MEAQTEHFAHITKMFLITVLAVISYGSSVCWSLLLTFCPILPLFVFQDIVVGIGIVILLYLSCAVTFFLAWKKASFMLLKTKKIVAPVACSPTIIAVLILLGHLMPVPVPVLAILWIIAGISYGLNLLEWSFFFSSIPSKYSGIAIPAGSMMGTLLFLLVVNTGNRFLSWALVVLVLSVSAAILVLLIKGLSAADFQAENYNESPVFTARSAASVGIQAAVFGLVTIKLFSLGTAATIICVGCGFVGGALALVLKTLGFAKGMSVAVLQRITLVPLIAGLIFLPFFEEVGQLICCCLINASHALYRTSGFGNLMGVNSEFRLQPIKRTAIGQLPHYIGFSIGLVAGLNNFITQPITDTQFEVMTGVIVIIVIAVALIYGMNDAELQAHLDTFLEPREGEQGRQELISEDFYDERVCITAQKYGLTPREKDILFYLGKGRSTQYIQKELFLANGTIKTHISHIYNKMSINSRQLLIDIMEDANNGT